MKNAKTQTNSKTPAAVQQSEIVKLSTALEALGYSVASFKTGRFFITVKLSAAQRQ